MTHIRSHQITDLFFEFDNRIRIQIQSSQNYCYFDSCASLLSFFLNQQNRYGDSNFVWLSRSTTYMQRNMLS
jgi:hypothetical protein